MIDYDKIISLAEKRCAEYVDVRYQDVAYELIVIYNGILREYSTSANMGLVLRVLVDGYLGFTASNHSFARRLHVYVDSEISLT